MGVKVVEIDLRDGMMLKWCPLKSNMTNYSLLNSRCVNHLLQFYVSVRCKFSKMVFNTARKNVFGQLVRAFKLLYALISVVDF